MTVADVYRGLWRHRVLVVLVTFAVVAFAYLATSRQTKLYTATSLVRVQQQVRSAEESFGALLTGERLARTYQQIAETNSVRDLVLTDLQGSVPSDAVVIEASQLSNLELLQLSVTNKDPKVAATIANAVPRALATFVKRTGTFRDSITVVERAKQPTSPSSPNVKLNLALAFIMGLILAAGLALSIETLSDRIDSVQELEHASGHPVIAVIPNLKFQPAPSIRSLNPARTLGVARASVRRARSTGDDAEDEPVARWSVRG